MHENHGALVGWTAHDLGSRIAFEFESVKTPGPHGPDDVDTHLFVVDKAQALQLGTYLFRVTDQTEPRRRTRGLLRRLFSA
jgi:hypothetical protein